MFLALTTLWVIGEFAYLEGLWYRWSRLEVGRLSLNHSYDHVLSPGELILIENTVFRGSTVYLGRSLTLNENTASRIDIDLVLGNLVKVMICNLGPNILHIRRRRFCEVKHKRCSDAILIQS
jgi:hypothetical protein